MSTTIPTTAIRSLGTTNPTHTAVAGLLYFNVSTGVVWIQQDSPTGSNWQLAKRDFNAYGPGGYARYEDPRAYNHV